MEIHTIKLSLANCYLLEAQAGFVNYSRPAPGPLIFDRQAFKAALAKLDQLNIHSVYPGHGKPFAWEQYEKPNGTA